MKFKTNLVIVAVIVLAGCENTTEPEESMLDHGLFMYYPLNGNANDESGHSFHGKVIGATFAEDRFGNAHSALSLDGIDDYAELQNDNIDIIGSLTISVWAKGVACQNCDTKETGLFSVGDFNPYGLGVDSSGRLLFRVVASRLAFVVQEAETKIDSAQWHNYVGVFKSGQYLKLFIDGQEVDSNVTNIPVALVESVGKFWIGGRSSGDLAIRPDFVFDGLIDDVRVYSRALSEEEIEQLYTAGE